MAGLVAGKAVDSIIGDVRREWSTTVTGITGAEQPQTIDWANINYPPLLRFFHYDPEELPTPAKRVVKLIHAVFLATCVVLVVSFVNNIVLAAGGAGSIRLAYALLNLVIFIPVSGYAFYQGYSGVALTSNSRITIYCVIQGIIVFLALVFVFMSGGGHNGFVSFATMKRATHDNVSSGMKTYWSIAIIIEALCWLFICAFGSWSMYKTWTFNPYHSQENGGGDARSAAA